MALLIQTTGLQEYAPGGTARVKVLMIGGPGVGKTRWSSYFPKPIYADCERGLASVADRQVPYVSINTSQDILDLLAHLKQECRQPQEQRQFDTIVIDTLDAFQRKVKNEWLEREKKQVFSGWEAWGFLNSRMQMLMTRLLNLDMNVIVNVHYKDKKTKDDETGAESHELMLQLQGETADTAFNDFDLVGWMGTYWESVDGERQQRRGITFKPKPDRPFLKDRLHVTPDWLEVVFAESDYARLFERIQAKVEELGDSGVVGEVPSEAPALPAPGVPAPGVVAPGQVGTGALPSVGKPAAPLGYTQMDKPTLTQLCRDREIATTVDGTPIKNNTLKAELIAALEANDASATTATAPAGPAAEPAPAEVPPTPPAEPVQPQQPAEPAAAPAEPEAPAPPRVSKNRVQTEAGAVDVRTGELVDDPATKAVALVAAELGGQVIQDKAEPRTPAVPAQRQAPAVEADTKPKQVCEECGADLSTEDPDIAKLSWIKFRARLCEKDFAARKAGK